MSFLSLSFLSFTFNMTHIYLSILCKLNSMQSLYMRKILFHNPDLLIWIRLQWMNLQSSIHSSLNDSLVLQLSYVTRVLSLEASVFFYYVKGFSIITLLPGVFLNKGVISHFPKSVWCDASIRSFVLTFVVQEIIHL